MASHRSPTACTKTCGQQAFTTLQKLWASHSSSNNTNSLPVKLPLTSPSRLTSKNSKTILYLAYGSNLCAETFKGARGIKPLSALNVHVPSLSLTFDLAGIPYKEPCFANTRYRTPSQPPATPSSNDYHKDRWHKGLIGVVYEVTPEDYRTIIATEGGGASYHDIVVPCYALPVGSKVVDPVPNGAPFEAHTLLMPQNDEKHVHDSARQGIHRPNPSYAQASARYLKLITDGGEEHALPEEYMAYLYSLRSYTITSIRQRVGQVIVEAFWMPVLLCLFLLGKLVSDEDGKIPKWLATWLGWAFSALWASYDIGLKRIFGDGERTMGDWEEDKERGVSGMCSWREKSIRL